MAYPPEVFQELERNAERKSPDEQYLWAKANATAAHVKAQCDLDELKAVLAQVPTVLDPDKDTGVEETDAYVLAVAMRLRAAGVDARVVTEERRDTPSKMSMSTAAGVLGLPCIPLKAFLTLTK